MRISRHQMFMEIAHVVAKRSTCFRLNVGAVIVVNNRIVSIGYNGTPSGEPHCQGNNCPGRFSCTETIHAEDNALKHLPASCVNLDKDIYVTDSPCQNCASLLYNAGVKRIFYSTPYRDTSSLDWLTEREIKVCRLTPAGYLIEWPTGNVHEA